ncbi:hypothetical protein PS720_06446 [Pseudomonas fluorescens]|nr:hypothetical protein PS720_06355 [Pseudomonas fluorescens]VVO45079.1 hypothetical protein PS720_06446 [Pseudomonas fluorescens]
MGVGVADGAHVHAEQLEFGRHVRAHKRLGGLLAEQRGNPTGHLVARRDQAEQAAVPGGAFANRVDVRVAAQALVVDHHAATRTDLQAGLASQCVLGADAGGKHDQVGFEELVIGKIHAIAVLLAGADRLSRTRQMHPHAQALDLRLERQAAKIVQLHRHQARRELHHVRFKAQALQRVGGFQAQQATAHHHTAPRIGGGLTDGIQVFKGAVHQARIAFGALDGRYERIGTGRQHQLVIGHATVGGDHLAAGAVDLHYRHAQVQRHPRRLVQRGF